MHEESLVMRHGDTSIQETWFPQLRRAIRQLHDEMMPDFYPLPFVLDDG